ncbi:MAG: [acyl-carrier-protein] S-malonyltransferase [Chloroflexi bacterium]|nr:MAG: [acyl-carrier-protein] S-malonyltransferase [Chloroflexota bacterium]
MSTAYLFPGQGSQFVGMGRPFFENSQAARTIFEQADELLGFSLSTLCFEGPEEALTNTANQQPALFVTSIAALMAMREQADKWPPADFVAGHSLGEFSALVAAGSLSFADGLKLVQRRGELMKQAGEQQPGAMAAILALSLEQVETICTQASQEANAPVQIANDNCPGQIVISGDASALEKAMQLAEASGARKVIRLPISVAAHSALMATAAGAFSQLVDETPIQPPQIPIIGNVSARPLRSVDEIRAELKAQLTSAVRWTDSMNYLCEQGVDTVIEIGAGNVLLNLMKRINRQVTRIKFELDTE